MAWTSNGANAELQAGINHQVNPGRSNPGSITLADGGLQADSDRWAAMTPHGVLNSATAGSSDGSLQQYQRDQGTYQPGSVSNMEDSSTRAATIRKEKEMGNYAEERRPLHDDAVPLPRKGMKAGAADQGELASRKNEILNTGTIGYVPGHSGTGRGSSASAGGVEEAPQASARGPMQYGVARPAERPRPMPHDVPMEEEYTRAGRRVRYLDGSNRLMRDRPDLLAEMNHPDTPPDDKRNIQADITARDSYHGHRYW